MSISLNTYIILNIILFYFILRQLKKPNPHKNNPINLKLYYILYICIIIVLILFISALLKNAIGYLKFGQLDIKVLFINMFWIQMCMVNILNIRNYIK